MEMCVHWSWTHQNFYTGMHVCLSSMDIYIDMDMDTDMDMDGYVDVDGGEKETGGALLHVCVFSTFTSLM
jgi:hypothetical protein